MNKSQLATALQRLPKVTDERLIIGAGTFDDASIFRIDDELALVSTVDVMDAIGEDYYRFGRVAAANSLSDVYAMGGEPLIALNVVCTPAAQEDMERLYQVLKGAQEVIGEAGAVVGGGHTTVSEHFKFGLAVTGSIHPGKIVPNGGALPGDRLVLTKPLGAMTILNGMLPKDPTHESVDRAFAVLEQLNREASLAMVAAGAHACTDVTGFGFLGHLSQMMEASGTTACIWSDQLPILDGALEHALGHSWDRVLNQYSFAKQIRIDAEVPEAIANILFEAVTSGGLLIAIDPERERELLADLRARGVTAASIGEVIAPKPDSQVIIEG